MPLIQVDTSCDLSDADQKQALLKTLSKLTAEGIGKPEQYVMVSVRDNVPMTMNGQAGPTAFVTIKSIGGLGKSVNQVLATHVSEALEKALAIPPDRVYLTFEEVTAINWAWNGRTFG